MQQLEGAIMHVNHVGRERQHVYAATGTINDASKTKTRERHPVYAATGKLQNAGKHNQTESDTHARMLIKRMGREHHPVYAATGGNQSDCNTRSATPCTQPLGEAITLVRHMHRATGANQNAGKTEGPGAPPCVYAATRKHPATPGCW